MEQGTLRIVNVLEGLVFGATTKTQRTELAETAIQTLNEKQKRNSKKMNTDRKSNWVEVDTLVEPITKTGVKITRNRGNYNIQIIHEFDGGRTGIFLPVTDKEPALEDVLYSLVKAAKERIKEEQDKHQAQIRSPSHAPKGKEKEKKKEGKGLSQLAREDAQAKGHQHVGPTDRKRQKKRASAAP